MLLNKLLSEVGISFSDPDHDAGAVEREGAARQSHANKNKIALDVLERWAKTIPELNVTIHQPNRWVSGSEASFAATGEINGKSLWIRYTDGKYQITANSSSEILFDEHTQIYLIKYINKHCKPLNLYNTDIGKKYVNLATVHTLSQPDAEEAWTKAFQAIIEEFK
jgi:hypothetical protein